MHRSAADLRARPAHVPPELVYDFDFFAPPGAEDDVHLAWKRLHETAPDIFWTPRNGGHWVATRADDILELQTNHRRFSTRVLNFDGAREHRPLPLGLDPPEHAPYRRLLMPAFLPKAVDSVETMVRDLATELVASIKPRGHCEFIEDFARKLPIAVFLKMVDLPFEDREILLPLVEARVRSPNEVERKQAEAGLQAYLGKWVEARRAAPGDDLISTVIHARIGDRPITTEEIYNVLGLLLLAGLDTVVSMLGFICRTLAIHQELRRDLIAHPELQRNAVEELIRRHGVSNLARYITEDCTYKGVTFKAGDLIQVPNALYGLDERMNSDAAAVDFRRTPVQHAAFGNGPHACPGAILARREIAIFLEVWLGLIPEFSLKPGSKPEMASGYVSGVTRLDLVWDSCDAAA